MREYYNKKWGKLYALWLDKYLVWTQIIDNIMFFHVTIYFTDNLDVFLNIKLIYKSFVQKVDISETLNAKMNFLIC